MSPADDAIGRQHEGVAQGVDVSVGELDARQGIDRTLGGLPLGPAGVEAEGRDVPILAVDRVALQGLDGRLDRVSETGQRAGEGGFLRRHPPDEVRRAHARFGVLVDRPEIVTALHLSHGRPGHGNGCRGNGERSEDTREHGPTLARRLADGEEVAFAQLGAAPALELLIVAAQRVLLRKIADDVLLGRRFEDRQASRPPCPRSGRARCVRSRRPAGRRRRPWRSCAPSAPRGRAASPRAAPRRRAMPTYSPVSETTNTRLVLPGGILLAQLGERRRFGHRLGIGAHQPARPSDRPASRCRARRGCRCRAGGSARSRRNSRRSAARWSRR